MPKIQHSPIRLQANAARVVVRPFHIAPPNRSPAADENTRARRIVEAVLNMDLRTTRAELALVGKDFEARHWQTRLVYLERYEQIARELKLDGAGLRDEQRQLIGAYFCHEYSYAAAALMNPSVVPHVDQSGLQPGSMRFIMSLRAVGEGHISSIAFREGILFDHSMTLLPEPPFAMAAQADNYGVLPDTVEAGPVSVRRHDEASLSGTVIFPVTAAQRNGLEDLRLVRFQDPDHEGGKAVTLGTYTAFNGSEIQSEMMQTEDFRSFRLSPMRGSAARNKGMALFPRKVGGQYAMIGRQDGENVFLIRSDDLMSWDEGQLLLAPKFAWELVQLGNCGSPIEIDEGWLLLTHGVGAMRQYSIGAVLLDKDDPSKVIGRLPNPIVSPVDENREGYVPNVVYTCGGIVNGRTLFMPYGVADSSVAFAFLDLDDLLSQMV